MRLVCCQAEPDIPMTKSGKQGLSLTPMRPFEALKPGLVPILADPVAPHGLRSRRAWRVIDRSTRCRLLF